MGKLIRLELFSKFSTPASFILQNAVNLWIKTSSPTRATMFFFLVTLISHLSLGPMDRESPIRKSQQFPVQTFL